MLGRTRTRRGPWRARVLVLAVLVATAFVSSACATGTAVVPLDPSFAAFPITNDHPDNYAITGQDGAIVASAPTTNTGGNTRIAFWPRDEAPTGDHEVCATWRSSSDSFRQEGLVLRLRFDQGVGQAILITKNVWMNSFWTLNVSRWRSTDTPQSITLLQAFDLSAGLGRDAGLAPLPWRICAKVVDTEVSFVVWPLAEARPAWGDPTHSGTVVVPADLMAPGVGGWYIGHLQPGQDVVYDDLSVGAPSADVA